jgi:hypothetical protein
MALAGRGRALALVAVVALAAVGAWSLASRADPGGGAGNTGGGPRFTVASATVTGVGNQAVTQVFVVDAQTMRLLVYTVDQSTHMLKLFAARDISEDVRILQYNNDHPWPDEMRSRLQTGGGSATKAEK